MTHSLLHSTIARLTGDPVATIQRIGFCLKHRTSSDQPDADDPVAVIDCPCCGATVVVGWNRTDPLPEFAECRRCETVIPYSESEIYETDLFDVPVHATRALAPAA
jgi:hypothetical protein